MCWSITGSNYDIDLEFEDDLTRGQKVKLAERVVASLQIMACPYTIFPHQISGCDYGALIPVIKWLLKILRESRDVRGLINRRQGLLNYKLRTESATYMQQAEPATVDPAKLKQIIFNGKPKRVYKATRNAEMGFQDPKRVHTALREFNDLSANKVFQGIIEQIQQLADEQSGGGLGFKRRNTVGAPSERGEPMTGSQASSSLLPRTSGVAGGVGGGTGLESLELESATADDIIQNVEKMLAQEQARNE